MLGTEEKMVTRILYQQKGQVKMMNEVVMQGQGSFDVLATFGKIRKELGKIGMKLGIVSLQTGHQWLLCTGKRFSKGELMNMNEEKVVRRKGWICSRGVTVAKEYFT